MGTVKAMITTAVNTGNAAISSSKTVCNTIVAIAMSREAKAIYRFTLLMAQLGFWGAVWLGATTVEAGQRFRRYYEQHHEEWAETAEVTATQSIKVAKALWATAQVTAQNSKAAAASLNSWLSRAIEFLRTLTAIAKVEAEVRNKDEAQAGPVSGSL